MATPQERLVIENHQRLLRRVAARVRAYVRAEWSQMGSYRDEDVRRFIGKVVPAVVSGERSVGQLTNAYLDQMARLNGVGPLPAAEPVVGAALRGVDPEDVYRRPAVTVYNALAEGKTFDEAVRLGGIRLDDIVGMDLQLAQTHTARERMSRGGGEFYRRILTGAENCALCAIASTQRYRTSNLMPIHPGCDCTVGPIFADSDPGQVINKELYERTLAQVESLGIDSTHIGTDGRFRDVSSVMIREHGEFGPTLTFRDQKFTGPNDI